MAKRSAESALSRLQGRLREGPLADFERFSMSRSVPDDLASPGASMLYLGPAEHDELERTHRVLDADPRFEHLDRKLDEALWRFACQAALLRGANHVTDFVRQHAITPQRLRCFFPIEHLTVEAPHPFDPVLLLPVSHSDVPPPEMGFKLEPPVGAIAAVDVEGTHYGRMAERGAQGVDRALRFLRAAMRAGRFSEDQLRFRRGIGWSFGKNLAGWKRREDEAVAVKLTPDLAEELDKSILSNLAHQPTNDVQRQAAIALRWIERGMLATEQVESLLFYFFALEALLGEKSEKLKGRQLAFDRAMLSVARDGSFWNPNHVYDLYADVRSAAVHGKEPPELAPKTVRDFGWDVRNALEDYLAFAEARGLSRRGKLLEALRGHPLRDELRAHLTEFMDDAWNEVQ